MKFNKCKLLLLCAVSGFSSAHTNANTASLNRSDNSFFESLDAIENTSNQPQWEDKNGYVIFEAENTSSDLGDWIVKSSVDGYKGSGHVEYNAGQTSGAGPAGSSLTYSFRVNTSGNYRLMLRAHRNLIDGIGHHSNDCWIRMEGDFGASTVDISGADNAMATEKILRKNTKYVGGLPDAWKWAPNLFVGHDKYVPVYNLKAGETYTLIVSGRSKGFNIDRFVLGDISKANWTQLTTSEKLPVTTIDGVITPNPTPEPTPSPTPQPTPITSNSGTPYKGGNIIYFSDGNGGDIDDVGANGLSLYTLNRAGLKDKVKLYVWADVFWYNGASGHKAVNQKTVNRAVSDWGYASDIFVSGDNYNTQRDQIVNSVKAQINAATAEEPLYLVFAGAGGFTYTYEAFEEISDKNKLKNVVLVSHSLFNEVFVDEVIDKDGDGIRNGIPAYSWVDLEGAFSQPTYWSHKVVLDQNGAGNAAIDGFASNGIGRVNGEESPQRWTPWNWMDSFNAETKFILDRMKETVVLSPTRTEHGKADASDFGMIWYMLTGNKKGNPYEVRDFYNTGQLPKPYFITNVDNDQRISSNSPLLSDDFQTVKESNGRLKVNTTRSVNTVSNTTTNLGTQWFKVPAPNGSNTNDFLLVNALTGLSLRSVNNNNGATFEVKNDYRVASNSVWYEKSPLLLTNRNTNKQFRKNADNTSLSQVTLTTDVAKWRFEDASGVENPDPIVPTDCSVIDAHDFEITNVTGFDPATKAQIPPLPADGVNHGEKVMAASKENGIDRPIAAETTYRGSAQNVTFTVKAVGEPDGECTYAVFVNGIKIGEKQTARIHNTSIPTYTYQDLVINTQPIAIKDGDVIRVTSNQVSNGLVPEGDKFATARGRWKSLEICGDGEGNSNEDNGSDVLTIAKAPTAISTKDLQVTVEVAYEAKDDRDINVAITEADGGFIKNNKATVTKGTGTTAITVSLDAPLPKGTGYRAVVTLRPKGGTFNDNIKKEVLNFDVVEGDLSTDEVYVDLSADDSVLVYPNPFDNELYIQLSNDYNFKNIEIIGLSGAIMYSGSIHASKSLELGSLFNNVPVGIYIINFYGEGKTGFLKVIKE